MAAVKNLRIALAIILVPAVAADSGDVFSNNLFAGITPLLALFGQDFANHFLSQSTSWLDNIIFAVGPLGVPAAIIAVIRVSGYGFLKGAIGRAGERTPSFEKDLLSSTSSEVCELWDGEKVVRLEATKPSIQELISVSGQWYSLRGAICEKVLKNKDTKMKATDTKVTDMNVIETKDTNKKDKITEVTERKDANIEDANTRKCESWDIDIENQRISGDHQESNVVEEKTSTAGSRTSRSEEKKNPETKNPEEREHPCLPPNISLNLNPENRWWELPFAAIFGTFLQLTVLVIAGLTTFYPQWAGQFSVPVYEFYCMAVGTVLLTFGLIVCVSVVDKCTEEETYVNVNDGESIHILWLQRGRSDSDQSFDPYIFGVERTRIRTSYRPATGSPSDYLKAWTLIGTVATMLGYIIQFIGLVGMHWPTQAAQFVVTLLMTGIRALICRAPPRPRMYLTNNDNPDTISDKHEMDWLATVTLPKTSSNVVWQMMMTAESLTNFQQLKYPPPDSEQGGNSHTQGQSAGSGQAVLEERCKLGALCKWTGPARTWAISLATAIDEVMNLLYNKTGQKVPFRWPLNIQAKEWPSDFQGDKWPSDDQTNKRTQTIWFTIQKYGNNRWESNISQLEAALSLGLFGDKHFKLIRENTSRESSKEVRTGENSIREVLGNAEEMAVTKGDWLRLDGVKERGKASITLLSPYSAASRGDLLWWLGPENSKLKEVSLHRDKDFLMIKQYRPIGLKDSVSVDEDDITIKRHRIAGFGYSCQAVDGSSVNQPRCLAAISEADLGLLYARHMFSAFMWTVAQEVNKLPATSKIDEKCIFIPTEENSWKSLELRNDTVEKLAMCVRRAGLGDMEDAYLAVIPPLSNQHKLPEPVEVFNKAWESAIEGQSQRNWESAFNVYQQLFDHFITFGPRCEWAVKVTALLTEFRMLLSRTTKPREGRVLEGSDEGGMLDELEKRVLGYLNMADGGVRECLKRLYDLQNESEECKENPIENQAEDSALKSLQVVLGQTELHYAAMKGNVDELNRLLQQKKPLMGKDFFGRTALHYAAYKGTDAKSKKAKSTDAKGMDGAIGSLLKYSSDRDMTDRYGMTPLLIAAERGNAKTCEVLVDYGANKDGRFQNRTALHIAAEIGHLAVVQTLVNLGANTALKTPNGRTALHLAVLGCHSGIISKLLSQHGSSAKDELGRTALHLAALHDRVETLLKIEEAEAEARKHREGLGDGGQRGANEGGAEEHGETSTWVLQLVGTEFVNAIDSDEKTALHLSAEYGHKRIVSLLLSSKLQLKICDSAGRTALHLAAENNHKAVVKLLLEKDKNTHSSETLCPEVSLQQRLGLENFLKRYLKWRPKRNEPRQVRIALIDTGIFDLRHLSSQVKVWENVKDGRSFVKKDGKERPWQLATDSHGTQMASLICAIDPLCELYVAMVADKTSRATPRRIVEAIRWAMKRKVDIIYIPFGFSERSDHLDHALKEAYYGGITILCSASDNGNIHQNVFPARNHTTISIASASRYGMTTGHTGHMGPTDCDFVFLGEDIVVDKIPFLESQVRVSGSSVATAIATGLASLILSCCHGAGIVARGEITIRQTFDRMTARNSRYVSPRELFSREDFSKVSIDEFVSRDLIRAH